MPQSHELRDFYYNLHSGSIFLPTDFLILYLIYKDVLPLKFVVYLPIPIKLYQNVVYFQLWQWRYACGQVNQQMMLFTGRVLN